MESILHFWIVQPVHGDCCILDSRDQGRKSLLLACTHQDSDSNDSQISLERMDEVFGVADFSNVEDVGIAARGAKRIDDEDVEDIQAPNKS